jgi:hypothetical protein
MNLCTDVDASRESVCAFWPNMSSRPAVAMPPIRATEGPSRSNDGIGLDDFNGPGTRQRRMQSIRVYRQGLRITIWWSDRPAVNGDERESGERHNLRPVLRYQNEDEEYDERWIGGVAGFFEKEVATVDGFGRAKKGQ